MEYKFMMTSNGPVVVTEDEIVFFHEQGVLQELVDANSDFFEKATEFLESELRAYADLTITQALSGDVTHFAMNRFQNTYGSTQALKSFEASVKSGALTGQAFPGNIVITPKEDSQE